MSKPAARVGDKSTGHDCWPPTTLVSGSSNVMANGVPVALIGSKWKPHTRKCKPKKTHTEVCVSGSSSVYVNGKPMCRVGDKLQHGDTIASGSGNVYAGG